MLAAMPGELLIEWQAMELLEPFGHVEEDRRHAETLMVASEGKVAVEKWRYKPPVELPEPPRRPTQRGVFGTGRD